MTTVAKPQIPLSLPVIDFTSRDLKPKTPEWDSVRPRVRKALEEYGCFKALFDRASVELRKAIFEASEEAFGLPLETKLSTKSDKLMYKGYILNDSEYAFIRSKNVQLFAEKLIELNAKVRTMTMESFGLDKYIEEHLNSTKNHLQLIKYKGVLDDDKEEKLGFNPHIDRQFLTILCQNDVVDGLEIKIKDGEEWIKAKPSQDSSFLVMAGASLHLLLNGGVFPPLHRVVITGKKDRYVAGLFLPPKEGLVINAPEEIVDDEHPRLYKPFSFEAYMKSLIRIPRGEIYLPSRPTVLFKHL